MPINADGKVMNLDNQTRQTIIQASENLFSQHGWQRISIGDICAEAKISRVSFYRYFKNKIELLKEIIALQQVKVKTRYTEILRDTTNIEELINAIFNYQEEALKQFFTAPVLKDFDNNKNKELNDFFDKERQKKYIFMNHLDRKSVV
jgi:AcrR family transcriptional regulator